MNNPFYRVMLKPRLFGICYGLCHLADGLVLMMSFGTFGLRSSTNFCFWWAKQDMKKRMRENKNK